MKWIPPFLLLIYSFTLNAQDGDTCTFNIGDQWVYETSEYFGGGHSFINFGAGSIIDTITENEIKVYILNEVNRFYTEGSKMFFWDQYLNEYIMYFDFDETTQYPIKYWDPFLEEMYIATVIIDSISTLILNGNTIDVQHTSVINSHTTNPYNVDVYRNIGTSHYGRRFVLGCGLCDNNLITTKLRCFSNDSISHNFVDYACDSTWLISSTLEILPVDINIYPNPTLENVLISGIDREINYKVYSSLGHLITSGITKNKTIELKQSGVLLISLNIGGRWVTRKIVKLE